MLDQVIALLLNLQDVGFLSVEGLLSHGLEVLLVLRVDVKTMGEWRPFGLIDEFSGSAATLFFISDNSIVDIHVVDPERALLGQRLDVQVIADNLSVLLFTLGASVWGGEMILTFKSLVTLDGVFELKLDLRVIW